ncbi:MAG: Methyltransferase type 11 [Verrucomicrobia bacterium]|nr:Methyltransferase type 11 [Verrucomicrobiota bacterium]
MEIDEYRKMAAVEDAMWYYRALHGHLHRALSEGLRATPGVAAPRVLDAGCGTGGLIRRLSNLEPTWRWTGVDLSPEACALARTRCGAEIREASITALPFPDATFEAVVSADVIYHVDDDGAALREFARVLVPGGVAVINVPAHRWLWSYHDEATHAKRRYQRGELTTKMQDADFRVSRVTHWNALPLPLVIVRRKLLPAPRGGSDVQLYPAPIEAGFRAAMAAERAWLGTGLTLPWGSSILAVGARRSAGLRPNGA